MDAKVIRWLGAVAAGAGALNVFLLGYPGDLISQTVLIIVGGMSVVAATMVAILKPQG